MLPGLVSAFDFGVRVECCVVFILFQDRTYLMVPASLLELYLDSMLAYGGTPVVVWVICICGDYQIILL